MLTQGNSQCPNPQVGPPTFSTSGSFITLSNVLLLLACPYASLVLLQLCAAVTTLALNTQHSAFKFLASLSHSLDTSLSPLHSPCASLFLQSLCLPLHQSTHHVLDARKCHITLPIPIPSHSTTIGSRRQPLMLFNRLSPLETALHAWRRNIWRK